ncbi:MAG: TRAP transporter small permease [Beijerinckiaceae bacterium]
MTHEVHTQITQEEAAQTFDTAPATIDYREVGFEDWFAILLFWLMTLAVIVQFVSRYVFNNSYAWTEEIAVYCLVGVVFVGAVTCFRLGRHIHVDFLYRYLSQPAGRVVSTLVDLLRIGVLAYLTYLSWRYASLIDDERMTTVDLPKSIVFYTVIFAFAMMTVRAVQVAIQNWRRGYSILERPSAFDGTEA